MSVIQVTGLPHTVKMPQLIYRMRNILKKSVKKFWIKEIADMRNSDLKEAKIEFLSYDDARQASKKLDKIIFTEAGVNSQLTTKFISIDRKRERERSPHRNRSSNYRGGHENHDRYFQQYSGGRDRSRSPIYNESSKLDLELELLRKQRMVIEEERRLLLERKKLELVKEFGPSASKELEHMEKYQDKRQRPKREERPARLSPPSHQRPARPKSKLPQFILPCKIIIGQMRSIITEKVEPGEKSALDKLIRTQLKRRIALALTDKNFMPADKIVELYRELHPSSTDEEMVTTTLKNLRLSHWPVPKKPDNQSEVDKKSEIHTITKEAHEKITENIETDPDTAIIPTSNLKDEPIEKPTASPETTAKKESEEIKEEEKDDVDAGDITIELTVNGPDEDWMENGVDWNDDESKETEAQAKN